VKVLVTEYSENGGHAHYAHLLVESLTKKGCDVSVLSRKTGTEFHSLVKAPYFTGSLRKLIRKQKIDIVHFFQSFPYYKTILFLLQNKLTRKVRTAYTVHNFRLHEDKSFRGFVFFIIQYIILILVDGIIVHSQYNKNELPKFLANKSRVIFHGHYGWFDKHRYTKAQARRKLNIPSGAFMILFFGAVREYKGLEYLIDAVRGMRNALLVIAGKVWKDMSKKVGAVENEPFIQLHDELIPNDDIELYYKAADCAVFPYTSITTSGALTVAMAMKKPIIVTNIGSVEEIAGGSVLLVPPKNTHALQNALERLQKDGRLRTALGKKAYTRAIKDFSWENSAKQTLVLYKDITR